jgi:GNAT superfamily N-acetyltransferase
MTSTTAIPFVIRDGLETDIERCLRLDHRYETDHVWQMHIQQEETNHWQISFRKERLPRRLEAAVPQHEARLRAALPDDQCFLVATRRGSEDVLGYLTMLHDPINHLGLIRDLLVGAPVRGHQIGTRLLSVASSWAKERSINRLQIELQTKNFPGISFCQQRGFTFCGFNDRVFPNQDIAVYFGLSLR